VSPFYPPGTQPEGTDDSPYFKSLEELAHHQEENLRLALGDELYEWMEECGEKGNKK